jgi:hypothetical protein
MAEVHWLPICVTCPYAKKVISHTTGKLLFDGYFHLEDETLPVKRILCVKDKLFYVEIVNKQKKEDTSEYSDIEEGRICFFPTNRIDLEYKIIKYVEENKELSELYEEIIKEEHNVTERNMYFKRRKDEKELEEKTAYWKSLHNKKE